MASSDKKQDPIAIKCTLTWPYLTKKNELADKYTIDCSNLAEADAKKLKKMGMNVRRDKAPEDPEKKKKWVDRGYFIQAKNPTAPKVFGPDRERLDVDTISKIANGSRAVVTLVPYEWEFKGTKGVGAGLGSLVVFKIVEYGGRDLPVDDLADMIGDDEVDEDSMHSAPAADTSEDETEEGSDGLEDSGSDDDGDNELDDELPF